MGNAVSRSGKSCSNITLYNFKQGNLGNCGMIAAMAKLAKNKTLCNKVAPKWQNFKANDSSKVVFNLFKLGRPHAVEVSKRLPTKNYRLVYGKSSNNNLMGPLLEKALVHLLFDGNYESANGVPATLVMSSLTNNFFEEVPFVSNDSGFKFEELADHGFKTNSQMVVAFRKPVSEYNLITHHYYSLVEVHKTKKDFFTLYNPHGKTLSIRKSVITRKNLMFEISYFGNKIFRIPEIKTSVDFNVSWPTLKRNYKQIHLVIYDLLVNECDTEILINIIAQHDRKNLGVKPKIFIMTNGDKMTPVKNSIFEEQFFFQRQSLRENLKRGKYKILVFLSKEDEMDSCAKCRKYLENCGNEFRFRLAASKECSVKKPSKKDTEKIKKLLFKYLES